MIQTQLPLSSIAGNEVAKRAIEISLTGNHSINFIGNTEAILLSNRARFLGLNSKSLKPCSCGNFKDPNNACSCTPEQLQTHYNQLENLQADLTIYTTKPTYEQIIRAYNNQNEAELTLLERVKQAKTREIKIDLPKIDSLLSQATKTLLLDQLQFLKVLEISKTIAKLANSPEVENQHLAEALQYRFKT
ncbi:MAG: hypothetical protein WC549_00405 [Actinomycetota bacterium]